MAAHKGSFASLVREILAEKGQASTTEIKEEAVRRAEPSVIAGRRVRSMVQHSLKDLMASGEVIRVNVGVYRWLNRKEPVQVRQKMWTILRARRVVSIDDLMELADASQDYAKQWLGMLVAHEIVIRQDDGRYRLVNDTVEQPANEAKAEKLRQIRRRKALQTMSEALKNLTEACKILESES